MLAYRIPIGIRRLGFVDWDCSIGIRRLELGLELGLGYSPMMRTPLTTALALTASVIALVSACSRPPSPEGAAATPPASAATPAPEGAPVGPAAEVSVPMAVAHATEVPPQHGVPPTGDSSMPTEPIAQPAGGTSIAEVWASRQALAGKTVTVRGKVVKFHAAIMNRNWLHLQDGTGKPADGSHDLTFTTGDVAKVGDIVTATGTVAIDKDFTAGYKYGVIVEGASLK